MGRLLKNLAIAAAAILAVLVIAVVAFLLLFDPNDFRDDIAAEVKRTTGRDLVIEGDIDLSLFPWLAIDVGRSSLGNAPGFGDEPFLSFDRARLSVRLLPMLLRREVSVGTASLDGLELNLAVAANGSTNWEDLGAAEEAPAAEEEEPAAGGSLDVAGFELREATVRYADAQAGAQYVLRGFDLSAGAIAAGRPVELSGGGGFELQPADLAGDFAFDAVMTLDIEAATVALGDVELEILGLDISADVPAFSWEGDVAPVATIDIAAFSLKSLMRALGIEPPETANPDALGSVRAAMTARVTPEGTMLDDLRLVIDDTTFTGRAALLSDAAGTITADLKGDSIVLDDYMAPASEVPADEAAAEAPVEIPAELIRTLNLRANLALDSASMAGITFENVTLGVNAAGGKLRMQPISARLFDGTYEGDVRIDASGATPVLSVNERVAGVNVGTLAKAMFEQGNITGTVNGAFTLTGRGADMSQVQRTLNGTLAFELIDGTWEGRDVWYELRRARALLRKEPPPEPELPPRTRFSNVKLSGPVTDGVFRNDDLLAELPFLRLTGKGSVNLPEATVDYRLNARVLDKPELASAAGEAELADLTKTTIPLTVTGPLLAPSIKPDLQSVARERAESEVRERLVDKLLGGEEAAAAEGGATAEAVEGEAAEPKKKSDRDKLKDALRDLIKD